MSRKQLLSKQFIFRLLSLGFLLFLISCRQESLPKQKAQPHVVQVSIQSDWHGNARVDYPTSINIELIRQGMRFVGFSQEGYGDGRELPKKTIRIPLAAVNALRNSLEAEPATKLSLDEITINPGFIQTEINSEVGNFLKTSPPIAHQKINAYRYSLYGKGPLESLLTTGFNEKWYSHDYPTINIDMKLSDGTTLSAESSSWKAMMLPWKVNGDGLNYSTSISKAVASLLPMGSINRKRLLNNVENEHNASASVSLALQPMLSKITFDSVVPNGYRILSKRFKVSEIDYSNRHCKDLTTCFYVTLRLHDQPENLTLMTELTVKDGSLSAADLDRYQNMLKRVIESPIISEIKSNPKQHYLMHGSFGKVWSNPEVIKQFLTEMKANGKASVIPSEPEVLENGVLVSEWYGRTWVVFPDGITVLWMQYVSPGQKVTGSLCYEPPREGEIYSSDYFPMQCIGEIVNKEGGDH